MSHSTSQIPLVIVSNRFMCFATNVPHRHTSHWTKEKFIELLLFRFYAAAVMDSQQLVQTLRIGSNYRIESKNRHEWGAVFVNVSFFICIIFRFGPVDVDIMTNYLNSVKSYAPASNETRITILK